MTFVVGSVFGELLGGSHVSAAFSDSCLALFFAPAQAVRLDRHIGTDSESGLISFDSILATIRLAMFLKTSSTFSPVWAEVSKKVKPFI